MPPNPEPLYLTLYRRWLVQRDKVMAFARIARPMRRKRR